MIGAGIWVVAQLGGDGGEGGHCGCCGRGKEWIVDAIRVFGGIYDLGMLDPVFQRFARLYCVTDEKQSAEKNQQQDMLVKEPTTRSSSRHILILINILPDGSNSRYLQSASASDIVGILHVRC